MSAPVDVLMLLAAIASDNNCPCGEAVCSKQRTRREAIEARAAVERLYAERGRMIEERAELFKTLRAALAKFGGGV